ncbi:unnamed protein product, partial [Ectocarpus sp. 8 AP-2014]
WEWHVVEGVAAGRANHGSPYSRRRIPDRFFDPITGLSVDGTTEYLDSIVASDFGAKASWGKRRVRVHRRGRSSCLWRDKIQMINSVAFSLEKECLLVQVDADELWTAEQLVQLRDMFLLERKGDGGGNCAYFDCHFFVGPDLVTVTEDGWGHSASNEWLRAWVFRPRESVWLKHAPPELARHDEATGWMLLAGDQCIGREETRERGLVFTHYAYVLEEQVGILAFFW